MQISIFDFYGRHEIQFYWCDVISDQISIWAYICLQLCRIQCHSSQFRCTNHIEHNVFPAKSIRNKHTHASRLICVARMWLWSKCASGIQVDWHWINSCDRIYAEQRLVFFFFFKDCGAESNVNKLVLRFCVSFFYLESNKKKVEKCLKCKYL